MPYENSVETAVCEVWGDGRGRDLVRELCEREGAKAIVETVARLFTERDPRREAALMCLLVGLELPELSSAIEADACLAAALQTGLRSRNVHDRVSAIHALGMLPLSSGPAMLASAAEVMLLEPDLISLADILAIVEVPGLMERMLASQDWLFRWTLLAYTNLGDESALAKSVRGMLAADPHPLVAREAARHVAKLEKLELDRKAAELAAVESGLGAYFFGFTPGNDDDSLSFETLSRRFVDECLDEKDCYTLDELRAFLTEAERGSVTAR